MIGRTGAVAMKTIPEKKRGEEAMTVGEKERMAETVRNGAGVTMTIGGLIIETTTIDHVTMTTGDPAGAMDEDVMTTMMTVDPVGMTTGDVIMMMMSEGVIVIGGTGITTIVTERTIEIARDEAGVTTMIEGLIEMIEIETGGAGGLITMTNGRRIGTTMGMTVSVNGMKIIMPSKVNPRRRERSVGIQTPRLVLKMPVVLTAKSRHQPQILP